MQPESIHLTYHGHSAVQLAYQQTRLIIDPFITGNPLAKISADAIQADYVLLTHAHSDHFGDAHKIAQKNHATIIAPFELAVACEKRGLTAHPMHIGGAFQFPFGRVKLTIAHHGSGLDTGSTGFAYMGNPCGFLITLGNKTIYHAGDTGLFLDMQLIGQLNKIDVALLPIGDKFTMGIDDAVMAVQFLKPQLVIPMHYNTFPVVDADPHEFADKVQAAGFSAKIVESGTTIEI